MTYSIKLTNGTRLVDVPDGAVDTAATSLGLVGRNVAGYGSYQNTNFVSLLENFANNVAPDSPLVGQLWYDSVNKQLKVYSTFNSTFVWKELASSVIASARPPLGNAIPGDFWYNDTTNQLNVFNGSDFDLLTTNIPGFGKSKIEGSVIVGIKDGESLPTDNPVLSIIVDDAVVAIISKFEFEPSTPITNLHDNSVSAGRVMQGINFVGPAMVNGRVDQAHKLIDPIEGPLGAPSFVRNDSNDTQVIQSSLTVENTLAVSTVLNLEADGADARVTYTGDKLTFTAGEDVLVIDSTLPQHNITPVATTVNLGTPASTFNDVWAESLHGTVTGNVYGDVAGKLNGESVRVDKVLTRNGLDTVIDNTTPTPTFNGNLVGDVDANSIATVTLGVDGDLTVSGDINTASLQATGGNADDISVTNSTISDSSIVDSTLTGASLTSPEMTGTPTAPTAAVSVSTGQVATTQFVHNVLPYGSIIMWHGNLGQIPSGWTLCDGANSTPDLRDRFIIGAGSTGYKLPGTTGGSTVVNGGTSVEGAHDHSVSVNSHTLTSSEVPAHSHTFDDLYGLNDDASPACLDRYGNRLEYFSPWGSDGDADSGNPVYRAWRTDAEGGGGAHSHTAPNTSTEADHEHSVSISHMPPYYALCFIMKIY